MDGAAVTAAGGELMWNTAVDNTVAAAAGELVVSCCG